MASSSSSFFRLISLILLLISSMCMIHAVLGEITCENLGKDKCAFSVSSSGNRCVLETVVVGDGEMEYQCRTSEVVVPRMAGGCVETDECVNACGVDRNSVGLSTDVFFDPQFLSKLCSPACYRHCTNIVDLHFNLAAGEGVFLPDMCKGHRANPRRGMAELLMSSGGVAPGPVASSSFVVVADAPASAPL